MSGSRGHGVRHVRRNPRSPREEADSLEFLIYRQRKETFPAVSKMESVTGALEATHREGERESTEDEGFTEDRSCCGRTED